MDMTVKLDTVKMTKEMQVLMQTQAQQTLNAQVVSFFNERNVIHGNAVSKLKGDGLKQIEEMVTNRFLDEKFTQDMNTYFEQNWQRVFEECMVKALQRKANAIVFKKANDLTV